MTEEAVADVFSPYGTSHLNLAAAFRSLARRPYTAGCRHQGPIEPRAQVRRRPYEFSGLIICPALQIPIIIFSSCVMSRTHASNLPRGCAFVTYETQQEADAAVAALHGMCGCSNPPTMLPSLSHAVDIDAKACRTLSRFTSNFHSTFPF